MNLNITILKSKIHRATVTQASINYEGSITIDSALMKKTGILPYEKVLVTNINRGTRLETYAIKGKAGTGVIGLNGAAARLGKTGDKITIMSFTVLPQNKAAKFTPKIIVLDGQNRIKKC
jgi:aspartate 1-decarboxylase